MLKSTDVELRLEWSQVCVHSIKVNQMNEEDRRGVLDVWLLLQLFGLMVVICVVRVAR